MASAWLALLRALEPRLRRLAALLLIYLVARTGFPALPSVTMLESRYLVEYFTVMEVIAVQTLIGLSVIGLNRRLRAQPVRDSNSASIPGNA